MVGKSPVEASDDQRVALSALAGSRDRGEADRARAILLTLAGWTSPRIAEAFGVREDTVRLWRSDFALGRSRLRVQWRCTLSRPCSKNPWPIGRIGRSPACGPRSRRARVFVSAARNCPRRCEKKVPLAAP